MKSITTILIFLLLGTRIIAQTDTTASGSVEIMVIDSYITPETPHKFILSFFTDAKCTSKILVMNKLEFIVSKTLTEDHKIEIDLKKLNVQNVFDYRIIVKDSSGKETQSDLFEVNLPNGFVVPNDQDPGLFSICLGAVIFAIPSPTYVMINGEYRWSLAKEIPLINFYSLGYNYPSGYLGIEYSYIFNVERKNYLRFGYKQIVQVPEIKYLAPGIGVFTDFRGYNGLSAELSLGIFQIQNVFTFYARYRYNFQLIKGGIDFHEFSIGLYSNFFSLNL